MRKRIMSDIFNDPDRRQVQCSGTSTTENIIYVYSGAQHAWHGRLGPEAPVCDLEASDQHGLLVQHDG
jgi:hypothetical protein